MFSKSNISKYFIVILLLTGASIVSAQTAPVAGKIELEKADGTKEPLSGAMVEAYRTDIKQSPVTSKTDKKGFFSFAGLPIGATFVLAVSGPGAAPDLIAGVRPGNNSDRLSLVLKGGDGKRWTENEVRSAIANASGGGSTELTAEQKKQQEEFEKKRAEVAAKNKEIENKNAIVQRSLQEGNEAFNSKDYDTAVAKYTEGINADPDYVGSAPILLNNRGTVLKLKGVQTFNQSVKLSQAEKAAGMAGVKADLEAALDSFNRSWTILKNAPTADIENPENHAKSKYDALAGLTETYRLLVVTKVNPTKAADAKEAFDAYFEVETDPVKKAKAQLAYGDIMREVGDSDKAIAAYRVVLQTTPDNLDAMAGLGLSLFNSGVIASDKTQMQEGLNYMQKFADTAPDSHPLKLSVKEAVDYLKNTEKLAPQKVSASKKKN